MSLERALGCCRSAPSLRSSAPLSRWLGIGKVTRESDLDANSGQYTYLNGARPCTSEPVEQIRVANVEAIASRIPLWRPAQQQRSGCQRPVLQPMSPGVPSEHVCRLKRQTIIVSCE